MTATREAVVLPALLLTVTLLGGLRVASDVRLLPPGIDALALSMLLLASLARTRVLVPDALMHAARRPIENLSGAVVLLSLFAASSQCFNLLIPDRGLLRAIFVVFFLVQLLTTIAGIASRTAMLRSLFVLFGAAFILRFLVLEGLYAPDGSFLQRVVTAAMEGVTLGALDYEPHAPVTGYVAFAALTLYLIALVLLAPPASIVPELRRPSVDMTVRGLLVLLAALFATSCERGEPGTPPPSTPAATFTADQRNAALRAARVWQPPAVPIPEANLAENPPASDGFRSTAEVPCRFVVEPVGGTTPKFNCELGPGDIAKVKYGAANAELYAEAAATRLLNALGFGADRMYLVKRVKCRGCPAFPFQSLKCLEDTGLRRACFAGGLDYTSSMNLEPAVIERRFSGQKIESVKDQGWAWYELDRISAAHGGSPRAEVDALRLMAMVLVHWDNKAENQRLVCLEGARQPDGSCSRPFAILQDLGGSFGPIKVDLRNWRETPVWSDSKLCAVSMERLPWQGATFPERRISEEGRRFLLGLLEQLSGQQVMDLFTGSGVTTFDQVSAAGRDAKAWAAAFADKVRQIREAGPCEP